MDLKSIKTCELVQELKQRDGVEIKYAEPNQETEVSVNGPAIILIVID